MPKPDLYHNCVCNALRKDNWSVTHEHMSLQYGKRTVNIDIGAEKLIAAEKGKTKIAVEVKSFTEPSMVNALHIAIGQHSNYRRALKKNNEDRILFLQYPKTFTILFFKKK